MNPFRFQAFTAFEGFLLGRCYDCDQPIVAGQTVQTVPGTAAGCGTRPTWAHRHVACPPVVASSGEAE